MFASNQKMQTVSLSSRLTTKKLKMRLLEDLISHMKQHLQNAWKVYSKLFTKPPSHAANITISYSQE